MTVELHWSPPETAKLEQGIIKAFCLVFSGRKRVDEYTFTHPLMHCESVHAHVQVLILCLTFPLLLSTVGGMGGF